MIKISSSLYLDPIENEVYQCEKRTPLLNNPKKKIYQLVNAFYKNEIKKEQSLFFNSIFTKFKIIDCIINQFMWIIDDECVEYEKFVRNMKQSIVDEYYDLYNFIYENFNFYDREIIHLYLLKNLYGVDEENIPVDYFNRLSFEIYPLIQNKKIEEVVLELSERSKTKKYLSELNWNSIPSRINKSLMNNVVNEHEYQQYIKMRDQKKYSLLDIEWICSCDNPIKQLFYNDIVFINLHYKKLDKLMKSINLDQKAFDLIYPYIEKSVISSCFVYNNYEMINFDNRNILFHLEIDFGKKVENNHFIEIIRKDEFWYEKLMSKSMKELIVKSFNEKELNYYIKKIDLYDYCSFHNKGDHISLYNKLNSENKKYYLNTIGLDLLYVCRDLINTRDQILRLYRHVDYLKTECDINKFLSLGLDSVLEIENEIFNKKYSVFVRINELVIKGKLLNHKDLIILLFNKLNIKVYCSGTSDYREINILLKSLFLLDKDFFYKYVINNNLDLNLISFIDNESKVKIIDLLDKFNTKKSKKFFKFLSRSDLAKTRRYWLDSILDNKYHYIEEIVECADHVLNDQEWEHFV